MSKKDPMTEYYKAMAKCRKDLGKAAGSLVVLYIKAMDAGVPGVRADDDRLALSQAIREYEHYLSGQLSKRQKANGNGFHTEE
ncbi:hypothetical protein JKG47_00920 [Acidithiobacillus sp. MC6.1]|nr:hypothetical protein [Acidithiobacillus sp. MC6.1]